MILSSTILQQKVNDILVDIEDPNQPPENLFENLGNNLLHIELKFTSKEDLEWELVITELETFNITQDFENEFGDLIQCHVRLHPLDMIQLINRYQELEVTVKIEHYDIETTEIDMNMIPIIKKYIVFIKNMEDILKSTNVKQLMKTKDDEELEYIPTLREHSEFTMLIELQLIEEKLYTLQKSFVNCMLRNVNMDDAIKYITGHFNIEKLNYIEADNKTIIRHLVVPPENSYFDVIYTYLQMKYGVYNYDLNYYFTNDILYVYPKNNLFVEKNMLIHIINTQPNKISGINRLYQFKSDYKELFIINSLDTLSKNIYYEGIESEGTNFLFYRSDKGIDMIDNKDNTNITLPKDNLKVIDKGNLPLVKKNKINPKIIKPTVNIYNTVSKLTGIQFELVAIKLPTFFPFLQKEDFPFCIIPGCPIKMYYDSTDSILIKKGIIIFIEYQFTRTQYVNEKVFFTCSCNMIIKLEIEGKILDNDSKDIFSNISANTIDNKK